MALASPAMIGCETLAEQTSIVEARDLSPRAYHLLLLIAVELALLIHAAFVIVGAGFPLGDGGLFLSMIEDLRRGQYALPYFTTYNQAQIPFAYPPLSFYIAGFAAEVAHWSALDSLRFLPCAALLLATIAFIPLAQTVLDSRAEALVAVFAIVLLPRSFLTLIGGGGLPRSFGLLFALLAIYQGYALYRRGQLWRAAPLGLFAGLTLLTHLEMSWFLAITMGLFFLVYGRSRLGLLGTLLAGIGALALSAPWWLTVVMRHGVEPFIAASRTGSAMHGSVLSQLLRFDLTNEPWFPILTALALLGVLHTLRSRQFLLPLWLLAIILLDPRSFETHAIVPLALLIGIGVCRVLLPLLGSSVQIAMHNPRTAYSRRLARSVLAVVLIYSLFGAVFVGIVGDRLLPPEQREAITWIVRETPQSSRFLIVSGAPSWGVDDTSEWFAALSGRVSVATVQGTEWLPSQLFTQRIRNYKELRLCGESDAECLDAWADSTQERFDYIYIVKGSSADSGRYMLTLDFSLRRDANYLLVYDGAGASIFIKRTSDTASIE